MELVFLYILKMIGYSGALISYYFLFLRNKQYHQYNRYYLLLSIVLSLVLPFANIPVSWMSVPSQTTFYHQALDVIAISGFGFSEESKNDFNWGSIMLLFYLIVTVFLLLSMVNSIQKILKICRKYQKLRWRDINFYFTQEKEAPFSFFKNIFWKKGLDLNSDIGRQMFRHEFLHTRQFHSADLVFLQLVLSVLWFNPFFYIIKKELRAIHEYLADKFAISGANRYAYAEFIVSYALQEQYNASLTHYFFHSSIKRRIAMILKNSNSRFSYLERILAFPLLLALFYTLSLQAKTADSKPATSAVTTTSMPGKDSSSFEKFQRHMIKNMRYPQKAADKGVESILYYRAKMYEDGSISDFIPVSNPPEGEQVKGFSLVSLAKKDVVKAIPSKEFDKQFSAAIEKSAQSYENYSHGTSGTFRVIYFSFSFKVELP